MPYALILPLQQINTVPLPVAANEYAHAAFFDLLARLDSSLAARLHALGERKPFTLCLLPSSQTDTPIALRLTLLEDALFPVITDALIQGRANEGLRIGDALFALTNLLTTPQSHPLAGSANYAELWEEAPASDRVEVRFVSPTVFRSQKREILWPEPRLVWQSWTRAWLRNADINLSTLEEARLVELAGSEVAIERHRLQTQKVTLKNGSLMGFSGDCVYSVRELKEQDKRAFTALAHFAFYAGTGRKTAMGMGQTRLQR